LQLRARWELAKNDPLEFMKWFVFSLDPKDKRQPIKPFPAHRPHIQQMSRLWLETYNRSLLVRSPKTGEMIENTGMVLDKCRQIMATWFGCCVSLWDVLFHRGRLVFLQTKREEDAIGNEDAAAGLLGRCKFILRHVPGIEMLEPQLDMKTNFQSNKIVFPHLNSMLWAIPEGGDIIRSHTPSGVFSDECNFQPEFGNAYAAFIAGLRGGGWFYGCSSAHPGRFYDLCHDRLR